MQYGKRSKTQCAPTFGQKSKTNRKRYAEKYSSDGNRSSASTQDDIKSSLIFFLKLIKYYRIPNFNMSKDEGHYGGTAL